MMLAYPYLKIFTVFSSFPLIIGINSRYKEAAIELDQSADDGEQFVKRIFNGEKISAKPGVLMFTAPYKLCDGGCNESDNVNIAMQFPLFIGRKGQEAYRRIFRRDFVQLHSTKDSAPFKPRTSRATTTPCIIWKVNIITKIDPTTESTTESTTTTSTTTTPAPCPYFPPGVCLKRKKIASLITTFTKETSTFSPSFTYEPPIIDTQSSIDIEQSMANTAANGMSEVSVLRQPDDTSYLEDDPTYYYNYGYPTPDRHRRQQWNLLTTRAYF